MKRIEQYQKQEYLCEDLWSSLSVRNRPATELATLKVY